MNERVILLDSSGVLHSRFHAYVEERPAKVDGKGLDVGAIYGYCAYLRNMAKDLEYDRLIHVLDPEGGSAHRLVMYPKYKGNRSPSHPALSAQKNLLRPILEALGHTVVCRAGVESDDIIANLAKKFAAQGDEVLIVTSDKDLMQLVKDGEVVLARYVESTPGSRKVHEFYEEKDVEEKFGVRPDQVADYLALVGDSVDNIPGVDKVGPKTAAKWLQEYGSLAALMTKAEDIKGAVGDHLRAALPHLKLYRQLTGMLDIDVEIPPPTVTTPEKIAWARAIINPPSFWPDDINGDLRENVSQASPKSPAP